MTIEQSDTVILAKAIDRLATAFEQLVLTKLDSAPSDPFGATIAPVEIGDLPQKEIRPTTYGQCPVHHQPWKFVPAGISKKNGKAYSAFYACPEMGCDQRPPSEMPR